MAGLSFCFRYAVISALVAWLRGTSGGLPVSRQKRDTVTGDTWIYGWDALNRLWYVKHGSDSVQYDYDAEGQHDG